MRPWLITAENPLSAASRDRDGRASMRPRLITAENARRAGPPHRPATGFNEAAAHHRGERGVAAARRTHAQEASMRPRLITAENGVVAGAEFSAQFKLQ